LAMVRRILPVPPSGCVGCVDAAGGVADEELGLGGLIAF
jgi:hypothetical protein